MVQQQERQWAQQQAQQRLMEEMLERQRTEMENYRREIDGLRGRRDEAEGARIKLPKPTLQKLDPKEDIENFLATFERIAKQQKWPKEVWATQLAGLLTGKAMAAYTALFPEEAGKYETLKKTILHRYDVNEETHRVRFRKDPKKKEESYREWICRITDHFDKWTKEAGLDLRELIIMEQVLSGTPDDLAVWLRERKPKSLEELGKLAENYAQARNAEGRAESGRGVTPVERPGKLEKEKVSWEKKDGSSRFSGGGNRVKVNALGEKQCFHCQQWGHLMYNCPNRKDSKQKGAGKTALFGGSRPEVAWNQESEKYLRRGQLDGRPVQVLIDTGSSCTMVRADRVCPLKVNQTDTVPIMCVHGDSEDYPTTEVDLLLEGTKRKVRAVVAPSLPVPVVLGTDVYDVQEGWKDVELGLLVETRAAKKRRVAEEETAAGNVVQAVSKGIDGLVNDDKVIDGDEFVGEGSIHSKPTEGKQVVVDENVEVRDALDDCEGIAELFNEGSEVNWQGDMVEKEVHGGGGGGGGNLELRREELEQDPSEAKKLTTRWKSQEDVERKRCIISTC